jgi:hypothetical protein
MYFLNFMNNYILRVIIKYYIFSVQDVFSIYVSQVARMPHIQ